ncbi:MAG: hypothetical protein ACO1QS_03710 [Verrucomicrobiota bacterium]
MKKKQIGNRDEEREAQAGDGLIKTSLFMKRCLNSFAGSPVILPNLTHFRAAQTPAGRIFCCYSMMAIASLESSVAKRLTHKVWSSVLMSGSLLLAGCGEQETIKVYQAPKGNVAQAAYQVPAGWQEAAPNSVSVANFNISTPEGQKANVSIAPLPLLANRETEVVNMWRQQMGMGEVSGEEVSKLMQNVDVAGTKGKLFELTSKATGAEPAQQIITVMQHDTEKSWFYKISGDAELVVKEKANFLAFIKSVKLDQLTKPAKAAHAHQMEAPERAPVAAATEFKWSVPDAWKEVAPGSMVVAKFQMPPQKDATAEVTVSVFPSDTGGNLANINRWRGQLQLEPVDTAGLAKLVQPLDSAIPGSILVDMDNNGDRMVGAIVPRGGQWYFYKLRGATAVVEAQKAAFVAFARSEP